MEGVDRCRDGTGRLRYSLLRKRNARSAQALAASDLVSLVLDDHAALLFDGLAHRRNKRKVPDIADKVRAFGRCGLFAIHVPQLAGHSRLCEHSQMIALHPNGVVRALRDPHVRAYAGQSIARVPIEDQARLKLELGISAEKWNAFSTAINAPLPRNQVRQGGIVFTHKTLVDKCAFQPDCTYCVPLHCSALHACWRGTRLKNFRAPRPCTGWRRCNY